MQVRPSADFLRDVFATSGADEAIDARAGFREVFCDTLAEQSPHAPETASCESVLRLIPPEQGTVFPAPSPGEAPESFAILVVPGLGYSCVEGIIGEDSDLVRFAEGLGHVVRIAAIDGLASTRRNSADLYDQIVRFDAESGARRIVVLSYSKGTNDLLDALARYPDLENRISAVVGVASAVGGSPLALKAPLWAVNLLAGIPGIDCGEAPADALRSLYPDVRRRWLAEHSLPRSIAFFSVITLPEPDKLAPLLRVSYRELAESDPHNDGQVIARDQVIPGSRILAFVNADHWRIALPASRIASMTGSTGFGRDDFPRRALIEAVLRYVGAVVNDDRSAPQPTEFAPPAHRGDSEWQRSGPNLPVGETLLPGRPSGH